MYNPKRFNCKDCGVSTRDIEELYVVHDELWEEAMGKPNAPGMLCIGCLECRLGRKLVSGDFSDCLLNKWKLSPAPRKYRHLGRASHRLIARLLN